MTARCSRLVLSGRRLQARRASIFDAHEGVSPADQVTDMSKSISSAQDVIFATTFNRFQQSRDAHRIRILEMPYVPPAKHTAWDEFRRVFCILKASQRERVLLLNSSAGRYQPDTLALAVLGLLPGRRRPRVALLGDMWQPNRGLRHLMDRIIVRLADRAVDRYFVHSSEELRDFPLYWSLDKNKVRLCLYFYSLKESDMSAPPAPAGDYIFAGGNSHRDYEPLIEAARRMPHVKFVFATFRLNGRTDLPSNVTAGQVTHQEFMNLMRGALAVVTPIKKGLRRSAGQQTYLNAMMFRKPSIVNQTNGVRDHITSGVDGMIVDGSAESYVYALEWILAPQNADAVAKLCAAAHRTASERFSLNSHIEHAVQLMHELAS